MYIYTSNFFFKLASNCTCPPVAMSTCCKQKLDSLSMLSHTIGWVHYILDGIIGQVFTVKFVHEITYHKCIGTM